eukprot:m.71038 g.71038  ORF g.71038 m.71038 type:complete len:225 (+) comp12196_c0_seq4:140-814(+)
MFKLLLICCTVFIAVHAECFIEPDEHGHVIVPNGTTHLQDSAFNECFQLKSVDLPGTLVSLGSRAFRQCFNLNTITIPESVVTMGDFAFKACFALNYVDIPKSIQQIGHEAFADCKSLSSFRISHKTKDLNFQQVFENTPCEHVLENYTRDGVALINCELSTYASWPWFLNSGSDIDVLVQCDTESNNLCKEIASLRAQITKLTQLIDDIKEPCVCEDKHGCRP